MARAEIRVLGSLSARSGNGTRLGMGRPRVVLAVLALHHGEAVSRDRLIEAAWADRVPVTVNVQLQAVIAGLRRVLRADMIETDGPAYRLCVEPGELDLADVEAAIDAARSAASSGRVQEAATSYRKALTAWRGPAFDGLDSTYLAGQAIRLGQLRAAVVEEWARVELAVGHPEAVVDELSGVLAADPLRESASLLLMTAMYRSGRQAEALATFRATRSALCDNLGIEPGTELRELHQRMLTADPTLLPARSNTIEAPAPQGPADQSPLRETAGAAGRTSDAGPAISRPAGLPADLVGFTGRACALDRLDALLAEEGGRTGGGLRIAVVSGTGGVGKTTLAVHWAHRVASRFPDGQLYINLRGFDPAGTATTPEEAVRSFLDALDVPAQRVPAALDAQTALYRSLLAERRMLVLLDNARDAEQVRPLLPGAPGCLVLATSRNQLAGLVAGSGAFPLPLDLLAPGEARDLLAQRLGMDRIAAESAAVVKIVERCARLPLALAVVAARAATQPGLPLAALAAGLGHLHDRLDTLTTGDPGTDLRSVFSWSYQQLSRPAARLFRLLGVHPGPDLSGSAAASLAGIPPARVRPLLAELVRAHLVTERVPGRYAQHDLLRAYAGELALSEEPDEDRQAALRRLLDHYLRSAHRADAVLDPTRDAIEPVAPLGGVTVDNVGSAGAATEWFTAEYQVLMAAVRLAVAAGLDWHAWQLVWSIAPFIDRRGFRDAVALHRIALEAARRLSDLAAQGYSHLLCGKVYAMLGEYDEAREHLEHGLEIYLQLGDDTKQGLVHLVLGEMLDRQGRHRDALHQAEQAYDRYEASGHRAGLANTLNALGWYHAQLGNYETALNHCQQALRLQLEIGFRWGEAGTWDSLGFVYHRLGRHADAVASYRQALALFRDIGNRYSEAETLLHLGDTLGANENTSAARDNWRAALAILTDLDHPEAEQVRIRLRNSDDGGFDLPGR